MVDVELVSYKIAKLKMNNSIPESGMAKLQLEYIVGFDVKYRNDEVAVAVLTVQVKHRQHPNIFGIELDIQGIFRLDAINNIDAKKKHLKCYDELYPHAAQIMKYLAMNSGMQGFMLKKIPIEFADINFGAKPEDNVDRGKVIKLWSDI